MSASGWVGFDLDGTLAEYDGWKGIEHIGAPVPAMVDRVRRLLVEGVAVKVFTARVSGRDAEEAAAPIKRWCLEHIGQELPVTNVKDFGMWALYDDRCIAVEMNTGLVLGGREP